MSEATKKIMIAFGTRPEAIKMCPLVLELKKRGARVFVCLTGQHRELLLPVLQKFGVCADFNLDIMKDRQTLSELNSEILTRIDGILDIVRPDTVLVHGDTTTAFAVATACFYRRIPVCHVEAGLRSGDMGAPFPEEFNRRAISLVAKLHFAPTERAAANLLQEGISASRIFMTGNTVVDALKYTVEPSYTHSLLERYADKRIIFLTAHRRESHGETLERMLSAVRRITERYTDVCVLYPVHPNPEVYGCACRVLGDCERVELCAPFDVFDCHNILSRSYMTLTDSGGIQEEAAALGVPTLVMRDSTERPEGILCGSAMLAGTDTEQIFVTVCRLLDDKRLYKKMSSAKNPYGDGKASERIADIIMKKQ